MAKNASVLNQVGVHFITHTVYDEAFLWYFVWSAMQPMDDDEKELALALKQLEDAEKYAIQLEDKLDALHARLDALAALQSVPDDTTQTETTKADSDPTDASKSTSNSS